MSNLSIIFGALLVALGVGGFVASGQMHGVYAKTSLIPAYFGILIAIMGGVAQNPKLRMHAMHIAVTFGLLGFLISVFIFVKRVLISGEGSTLGRVSIIGMAVLTGVYTALCVRSFISARRTRLQEPTP